jgi:hypothetical protein
MLALMGALFLLVTLITPATPRLAYLTAIYLTFLELLLVTASVVLFSTFVSPVLAAVFSLGLFVIGHLSESIMDLGRLMGSGLQEQVTRVVFYVVPNLEIFNVRGAVVHGDPVALQHVLLATVYGLCFTGLYLMLAGAIFARRELK